MSKASRAFWSASAAIAVILLTPPRGSKLRIDHQRHKSECCPRGSATNNLDIETSTVTNVSESTVIEHNSSLDPRRKQTLSKGETMQRSLLLGGTSRAIFVLALSFSLVGEGRSQSLGFIGSPDQIETFDPSTGAFTGSVL